MLEENLGGRRRAGLKWLKSGRRRDQRSLKTSARHTQGNRKGLESRGDDFPLGQILADGASRVVVVAIQMSRRN